MIAPIINHYKKLSFQNVENRTALCQCGEEPHDHPACKINFFVDCCIKIKDKNLEGDVAECGVFKGTSFTRFSIFTIVQYSSVGSV